VRVFVYGSLRRGEQNAALVADLLATPARARGWLWALPEGWPALVLDPDGLPIEGELLDGVAPARLAQLDRFEGLDHGLYRRETAVVEVGGRYVLAQCYALSEHEVDLRGSQPLPFTDWARRRSWL
jgi:gamma-glutamylcyclotransferase (GGCT)/AIG2-like uncharacterized protein YtfP